jgi:hypothetical protein
MGPGPIVGDEHENVGPFRRRQDGGRQRRKRQKKESEDAIGHEISSGIDDETRLVILEAMQSCVNGNSECRCDRNVGAPRQNGKERNERNLDDRFGVAQALLSHNFQSDSFTFGDGVKR